MVLLERSDRVGGLVVSFEIGGTPLECFYHHVFPHEHEIQRSSTSSGSRRSSSGSRARVGVFTGGRLWPFTSPLDLLRFRPLCRSSTGSAPGSARCGSAGSKDWEPLDEVRARDWLEQYTGPRAAEVVWDPLLAAKFGPAADDVPAAWMWGRFQQRAGARKGGGEKLGYLRGGFRQLFDARGGRARASSASTSAPAPASRAIAVDGRPGDRRRDRRRRQVDADHVLFTGPLPVLSRSGRRRSRRPTVDGIGALGVLCVVARAAPPGAAQIYWTNVCDPEAALRRRHRAHQPDARVRTTADATSCT